jgi:hypothetical protein
MAVTDSDTEAAGEYDSYFWIDNCETAYIPGQGHGDVGRNISDHPESQVAGFEGPQHFDEKMEEVAERDDVSHSSQLVWWLANRSNTDDIEELEDVAVRAQHPGDYPDGFRYFNEFMHDKTASLDMVTASWERPVEKVVNEELGDYAPGVVGGRLKQNGNGIEVDRFCGGDEKADRIQEERGVDVSEVPSFAYGNSLGDQPMMEPAEEAIGRDRAYEFATLYTPDDPEFWTRGVLGVGGHELATGGDLEDAAREMEIFLETGDQIETYGDVELDEVTTGGREAGAYTEDLLDAYEAVTGGDTEW